MEPAVLVIAVPCRPNRQRGSIKMMDRSSLLRDKRWGNLFIPTTVFGNPRRRRLSMLRRYLSSIGIGHARLQASQPVSIILDAALR